MTGQPASISVVLMTFNEEKNLRRCLENLSCLTREIFIVDSGSTDRTLEIASEFGACVHTHSFETHSKQWQWALANLPINTEWVLGLDADQVVTPELREEIVQFVDGPRNSDPQIEGAYVRRRQVFRGKWIRRGGYYPKYLLKLFRAGSVIVDEGDLVDHHFRVRGKTVKLEADVIEDNRNETDISVWTAKHNKYAKLQAMEEYKYTSGVKQDILTAKLLGSPDERVLWLKSVWSRLPLYLRPFIYFIYRYFVRLGFLDGKQGFIFHFLQAFWYRLLVDINLDELRRGAANGLAPSDAINRESKEEHPESVQTQEWRPEHTASAEVISASKYLRKTKQVIILGINAYHGDAAAAIVRDGELVAAVEEERFNRRKHCAGFPSLSIQYCLKEADVTIDQVDHIAISRDPSAHLHKKVLYAATRAARGVAGLSRRTSSGAVPSDRDRSGAGARAGVGAALVEPEVSATGGGIGTGGFGSADADNDDAANGKHIGGRGFFGAVSERLANAARVRDLRDDIARALGVPRLALKTEFHNVEHHRAHLASSFFVSPFERAALLSIDGFGDFISTMWAVGDGNEIEVLGQVEYPHSSGIVYTATTQFLGFPHYGDEGKVMGLAPYGKPRYLAEFREIIKIEEGGRFRLNLDYFRHHAEGVDMTWDDGSPVIGRIFSDQYSELFGAPRQPGTPLGEREQDIAASLQARLEEVAFHILNHLHEETGLTDLGLSGGVAYNSVMNGKILLNTPFRRVFVQPAAGDSGTAVGACYHIYNQILGERRHFVMEGAYTGPEFSDDEIKAELERVGLKYESHSDREVTERAARDIAGGLVVGWFQGRMEFGPRALGNRSIVVDPRRPDMKDILNQRIKKREPFRPFAPSILAERVGDYFEQEHPAPTMLMVYQIKPGRRAEVPAVTHVDGSGRLQTVTREANGRYYQLISDFKKLTGVPIVLNTSFNENEPVVCTPAHAIDCFLKTKMDVLYLGNHSVRRLPG